MEPDRRRGVEGSVRGTNWTTIALIGGLVLLVLAAVYFATRGNADQDKLTNANITASVAPSGEKLCSSKSTYELIKRDLFRRAAQLRGSDQPAFDRLSGYAVLRMDNPVMESENSSSGAVHCSGSLSLDLPPGVAVVGGRRTLAADIDYSVQQATDGSGPVVLLSNADAVITPLATLSRVNEPTVPVAEGANEIAPEAGQGDVVAPPEPGPAAPAQPAEPATSRSTAARPSFNCTSAHSGGEIAVCSNSGLASLDRNMAAEYGRAMTEATPEQRAILQQTRDRFLRYRDRCPNNACVGDAYVGRMREIRDIMEGRWQPR